MDGGVGQATVHGVTKSQTWLSDLTLTFMFHEACCQQVQCVFNQCWGEFWWELEVVLSKAGKNTDLLKKMF